MTQFNGIYHPEFILKSSLISFLNTVHPASGTPQEGRKYKMFPLVEGEQGGAIIASLHQPRLHDQSEHLFVICLLVDRSVIH